MPMAPLNIAVPPALIVSTIIYHSRIAHSPNGDSEAAS